MKYLFSERSKIIKHFAKSGVCLLMLDFDGTLSNIAMSPAKAFINKKVKKNLKKLSNYKNLHIAIISGRSLPDIKNKVGVKGLAYAGNHGQEWEIKEKTFAAQIPKSYKNAISTFKNKLKEVIKGYKGAFFEYKGIGIAVHYRQLEKEAHKKFKDIVNSILYPFIHNKSLTIVNGKKVIDIRPMSKLNKGSFAIYYLNLLAKKNIKPTVMYIGDDATDEDAFKALKRHITVRVGKKYNSAARYYIQDVKETAVILQNVADYMQKGYN